MDKIRMSAAQVHESAEIELCFAIRREVFVEEQHVPPALEIDEDDAACTHYLAYLDGAPVGTARVIRRGSISHIGRLAVLKACRRQGIGECLMRRMLADIAAAKAETVKLGAQCSATGFYEKWGFVPCGQRYDDAGIAHIPMQLPLTRKACA